MIWTKGSHQSAKFQTFGFSRKISPNLYFDRLLKVYKILAERYRGFVSHDPEDWCKIWRKTDLLFQKWQEFGEISPEHSSQVSETCSFICSYSAKYLMFDLRKYRGVIFHNTEEWYKIWRKTDMRNLANFHHSTRKCQNWTFKGMLLSNVENVWA